MSGTASHFIKLLKVEFEDMAEDIQLLETLSAERLKNAEITEYVYQENNVVLEQERRAVGYLAEILDDQRWMEDREINQLSEELSGEFDKHVRDLQYPMAVMEMIDRKLEKISRYVLS